MENLANLLRSVGALQIKASITPVGTLFRVGTARPPDNAKFANAPLQRHFQGAQRPAIECNDTFFLRSWRYFWCGFRLRFLK